VTHQGQHQYAAPLWRLPTVSGMTGLGRSQIYALIRAGHFPRPCKLSERCSAWDSAEIEGWIADRIAERDARAA